MTQNTFGSLFAGVGGFDLGFEAAGWDCKFQVEIDSNCRSVLQHRWPHVPKFNDVRTVNGANISFVDLITFGSPCQNLSGAGLHEGLNGTKSVLFFEATRIIKEMRDATNNEFPKWAVWENVPAALTSNKGTDFTTVLQEMASIGAHVIEWHVLDSQWFGVPQRRPRVFLVAGFDSRTSERCGQEILPVKEGVSWDQPSDKIGFYSNQGKYDQPQLGLVPPVKTIAPVCVAGETFYPRKLTPNEVERCMGWPDDHTKYLADGTEQSDSVRFRQCGNGVVAPVAKWIAGHILEHNRRLYD